MVRSMRQGRTEAAPMRTSSVSFTSRASAAA